MTFRNLMAPVAAVVVTLSLAGAAHADPAAAKAAVDAAKAQGVVGEQNDGFLGFVNAGRRQLYAQAATQNGVSPTAAGASAFRTVVQGKLRPGDFYQDAGGAWVKK